MCSTDPKCVAWDHKNGQCRFYEIETGMNLTFGFADWCKVGDGTGVSGLKVDLRPEDQCSELILLDLWQSNQTRLMKNGKRFGLREVDKGVYQLYPG